MPRVVYGGQPYNGVEGETILETLLRNGVRYPNSCRAGACQSCLVRMRSGVPPARAQAGLKDTWKQQGYVLACLARPDADCEIDTGSAELRHPARIKSRERLSPTVLRVILSLDEPLDFRAGQFVTLQRPDGLARSYSLASLPGSRNIELHVRRVPQGQMSSWLFEGAADGDLVTVTGPAGDCFYTRGRPDQPLLLAGTGTGLAPLWGILQDAIEAGHRGPIVLFHGARDESGLYLTSELKSLAARHGQFRYQPVVLSGPELDGCQVGPLDQAIVDGYPSLQGWRGFLCGDPDLVRALKRKVFLAGIASSDLFGDLFLSAPPPAGKADGTAADRTALNR